MPIDEIIVTGRRPFDLGNRMAEEFDRQEGDQFYDRDDYYDEMRYDDDGEDDEPEKEPKKAFVAPVLTPAVQKLLPEVITTGTRLAPRIGGGGMAWAYAIGALGAEIMRELSEQKLDEAYRTFIASGNRVKPDTPVRTIQPEVLEEIIVTPDYKLPPKPQFFDYDTDPFEMQTIWPQTTGPAVSFPAQTLPGLMPLEVPSPLPFRITNPKTRPETRPFADPFTQPFTQPQTRPETRPFTQPQTRPETRPFTQPQTRPTTRPTGSTRPTGLTRPQGTALPYEQPQPMPNFAANCPPCAKSPKEKKKKEKKRTECFRKLVKERLFPSDDDVYEWAQIDCITGREIPD